jgi:hypothetical protein
MKWNGGDGLDDVPVGVAVGGLGPIRVDAVHGHVNEFQDVLTVLHCHLDDGVEGDLDVGQLVERPLGKVGHDATDDSLVGDNQQVFGFVHFRKNFGETSGNRKNVN